MVQDIVYVLNVRSSDEYKEIGRYTKVFKTKENALSYVETFVKLEWQQDDFGMYYKDDYTLNEMEVM